jgi:septum formation protein
LAVDANFFDLYWSTGEGSDKAGCYAVQGFAAAFIQSIEGSYSGIMGLPLFETCRLLEQWRIAYWPQRQTPPPSSSETQ